MKKRMLLLTVLCGLGSALLLCSLISFVSAQALSAPAAKPATISEPQPSEHAPANHAQAQATPAAETPAAGMEFPVLRTIGGFTLVLSLILIAFLVARKIAPQYFNRCTPEKNLKLIENLSMGEKRSIALIQVGNKRFLVGNTQHQVTLLSPLEDSFSLVSEAEKNPSAESLPANPVDPFRRLYETEKNQSVPRPAKEKTIPPDVRAKMRQLREALES